MPLHTLCMMLARPRSERSGGSSSRTTDLTSGDSGLGACSTAWSASSSSSPHMSSTCHSSASTSSALTGSVSSAAAAPRARRSVAQPRAACCGASCSRACGCRAPQALRARQPPVSISRVQFGNFRADQGRMEPRTPAYEVHCVRILHRQATTSSSSSCAVLCCAECPRLHRSARLQLNVI